MTDNSNVYRYSGLISILGLAALVVGFIVMLLLPDLRYAAWSILGLGILLLAAAFVIDFRGVRRTLTGKRGRFTTGTTVMVSIFIGIILLVNAISIGNYHRFDLTGLSQFTLTSQTKDILSELETPVRALGFFVPNDPLGISGYATNLLEEYQNYTDQLSIETIDPDEHPDEARKYGISQYHTIVFETDKGRRLVSPLDVITFDAQGNPTGLEAEHAFTSAILEVTGTVQKKVYFLTGHGEANINANYSYAKQGLQDNLYKVETLDLARTPAIPDDCDTLIIAGPKELIPPEELATIAKYLVSGRQALILVNPDSPKEIKQLLGLWGVATSNGTAIEPSSYVVPNKDIPRIPRNRNAFGLSDVYFPGATAIIPFPEFEPTQAVTPEGQFSSEVVWRSENSDIQMYMLLWTSNDSWLDMNFDSVEEPEFNEDQDVKGPLSLGFLIFTTPDEAAGEEGTALIVIGDSDFASNQHFVNGNNGDLFLSAVNWLAAGKELISIDRKIMPFRRLIIGPEAERFINYSSIGLMPLLVLVIGGIIWWRRR